MGLLSRLLAICLALFAAAPSFAADPAPLAPAVPWTLDYATDSCALRRMFGEGDEQVYLEMRRFGPGRELQVTVTSKGLKIARGMDVRYRFSGSGEWRRDEQGLPVGTANGFKGVIFSPSLLDLPELDRLDDPRARDAYLLPLDLKAMEQELAARTDLLELRGTSGPPIALKLGPLDKPMAALNGCVDELITHWGIDVEAHQRLTRSAVPLNVQDFGSMMDYPPRMAIKDTPGIVNIRLSVDRKGLITDCHIQMPLSDPAFEESSCADIEHGLEFAPALDKDGQPIDSYWITKVVFHID